MEEQLLIEDMKTMLRERYVPFLDATLRKMTIAMDGNGTPDQLTQKNIVQKYKKLLLSTRRWTINGLQTCDLQLSQLFTLATEEPNCWWQNPPHRSSPKVVPRSSSLSTANGNPPNSPKPNSRVASIIASIESRLASSTTSQQPNEDHRNVLSQNPIHNNNETCDNLNNHNRNPKRKALSKTPKFNTDTARSSPASTSQQPEGRRLSECVICVEEPVNTVLYMCGHMCMCLECATVLRERGGNCPVCRAEIQDIIRVYES